jgi:hypothetical protein
MGPAMTDVSPLRATLVLALILVIGGCGAPTVYNNYYDSLYEPAQVRFASSVGPTLAVIRDNPFPSDTGNQGVLAAMQGQTMAAPLYFSQTARPDDRYGYKVVLNFGPSMYGSKEACQAQPTPPATKPPPERIAASAAFCVGNSLMSDAQGEVRDVAGPDDPKFRRFVSDLLVALTPSYNPNRRECGFRFGLGCM